MFRNNPVLLSILCFSLLFAVAINIEGWAMAIAELQGITGRNDSDLIFMADDFDTLDTQLEDLVDALKAVSIFI